MWKQIKGFDINCMGRKKGMCLQNVRLGFGIPAKYTDAKEDMIANRNAGTLHDISTIPNNVAVPVYVDTANVHEHIIVCDNGRYYSDGVEISKNTYKNYFGWGELCDGVRVVVEIPDSNLRYKAHIQDIGWTDWKDAGTIEGTEGEEKRIEAIILESNGDLEISYRVHCENIGWTDWKNSGEVAGTEGQSLRLEAIEIKSNKLLAVQEHIENIGWMPDSIGTNVIVGTVGKSLRLEAFKITILE